jgi:Anti-sigma-K factor rskA
MPLSEDQRALLRLLIDGDDYAEVGAVLGTGPEEVRARARDAADQLERDGDDPELSAAARERLDQLEGRTTGADPGAAAEAAPAERRAPRLTRAAWITIGAVLAALAIALVVVLSGGDSGDPAPSGPDVQEEVVSIELEPASGETARGTAQLVRVSDLPAIDIDVSGLEPNAPNQTYVLWLLGSGDEGLPIAFRDVGPDGRFVGRTRVPSAAAGLLPSIEFIDLSLASEREATEAVRAAAQASTLPGRFGTTIVRGSLPR